MNEYSVPITLACATETSLAKLRDSPHCTAAMPMHSCATAE